MRNGIRFVARCGLEERQGQRSRDKVNHHYHVLHVAHLGQFLHVPRVGHFPQCYCFLTILYNWANATGGKIDGYKLLSFKTTPNSA